MNSLAVHPSGKVALSVGRDKTVRLWNLLKVRTMQRIAWFLGLVTNVCACVRVYGACLYGYIIFCSSLVCLFEIHSFFHLSPYIY